MRISQRRWDRTHRALGADHIQPAVGASKVEGQHLAERQTTQIVFGQVREPADAAGNPAGQLSQGEAGGAEGLGGSQGGREWHFFEQDRNDPPQGAGQGHEVGPLPLDPRALQAVG